MQRRLLALLPAIALVAACATMESQPASVADTIARDPQLSTLNSLVTQAGLSDSLKAAGPLTVFAPTNEAFKAVPAKTMDELGKNPAMLKNVINYHVLHARVTSAEVKTGNAKTVEGGNVALSKAGEFVTVEEAMVEKADLMATNGVVHKVDRVLMPPKR